MAVFEGVQGGGHLTVFDFWRPLLGMVGVFVAWPAIFPSLYYGVVRHADVYSVEFDGVLIFIDYTLSILSSVVDFYEQ